MNQPTGFEYQPSQNIEIGLESSGEESDYKVNKNDRNGQIICYKRRRILKPVGAEVSACYVLFCKKSKSIQLAN